MVSVVIPTYNEQMNILHTIKRVSAFMKLYDDPYEIIVSDDASTDNTCFMVESEALSDSHIRLYKLPENQGKGAAIVNGFRKAIGTHILFIDADLQIDPEELDTFKKLMEINNADCVIGNKRHAYSNVETPFLRRVISAGYRLMVKILFNFPLSDTQVGFKLFKKKAVDEIVDKLLVKRFAFDIEMLVALRENRCRIIDAPVRLNRTSRLGSVSYGNIISVFKDTLAVWYRKNIKRHYACG